MESSFNKENTQKHLDQLFDQWFVKSISNFIRVPNLSSAYDENYQTNGLLEKAIEQVHQALVELEIDGLKRDIIKPGGCNPMVIYTVEPTDPTAKNIMLYGHLDKQPHFTGWDEGLSPIDPVIRGHYIYGRGSSDDGYAVFAAFLAVKLCQLQGLKLPRICMTLETEEESGSQSLNQLLDTSKDIIRNPDILICLDSGTIDYECLWITSSLRGYVVLDVEVEFGKVGFHSGDAGGVVPDPMMIMRELLDRVSDSKNGKVYQQLQVPIPEFKQTEAELIAQKFGDQLYKEFKCVEGGKMISQDDLVQLYLNKSWNPSLTVTGVEGLPQIASAGNVLSPKVTFRLSFRVSPPMKALDAKSILIKTLTENPPFNANVTIKNSYQGNGWRMKDLDPAVENTIRVGGETFFSNKTSSYGDGGSIPFLNDLGEKYPNSQIIALGVGGPDSNPHGPNESLNLKYCKSLIGSLAYMLCEFGKMK